MCREGFGAQEFTELETREHPHRIHPLCQAAPSPAAPTAFSRSGVRVPLDTPPALESFASCPCPAEGDAIGHGSQEPPAPSLWVPLIEGELLSPCSPAEVQTCPRHVPVPGLCFPGTAASSTLRPKPGTGGDRAPAGHGVGAALRGHRGAGGRAVTS